MKEEYCNDDKVDKGAYECMRMQRVEHNHCDYQRHRILHTYALKGTCSYPIYAEYCRASNAG